MPDAVPTGVVLLDKPVGLSSFAALGALKRAAGTRKVGHTGTLDPFATGLLLALVGGATRTASYFNGLAKRYTATFVFGAATDTDDSTGPVVRQAALPRLDDVTRAIEAFRGEISQRPPSYSAVHVNGRRAHELARRGETPRLAERTVTVYELEVTDHRVSKGFVEQIDVTVECSAGTYIRSIARDLGEVVASAAHVSELRRTAIGPFHVDEAHPADALEMPRDLVDAGDALGRLSGFRRIEVDASTAHALSFGKALGAADIAASNVAPEHRLLLAHEGRLIAVARVERGSIVYEMVLVRSLS